MKGAIFDVDGTLLDSMGVWGYACQIFFEKYNIVLSDEKANELREMALERSVPMIIKEYGLNMTAEDAINEVKATVAKAYLTTVPLKSGAREYLQKLKDGGVKIAVATSSYKELCEGAFRRLEIADLIDEYAFVSEVSRGKDFPDVYILAAQKLGAEPKDCTVYEDIVPGIKSAKQGGFMTCAIHDFSNEADTDVLKQYADHYITGWEDLL